MPKDYEAIRDSIHRRHPDMAMSAVKQHAAVIANSLRRTAGRPSINAEVASEKHKQH